jgi:RNA polymerase sigma factor (sigma-70 family)
VEIDFSVAKADRETFARIHEQHSEWLRRFALRFVGRRTDRAEELCQIAFTKIVERADRCDAGRDGELAGYLRRIVRNEVISEWRRNRPAALRAAAEDKERGRGVSSEPADRRCSPLQVLIEAERRAVVRSALALLPEQLRGMLRRRYWDGKTVSEIAEEFALSVPLVKKRLMQARQQLAVALGQGWQGVSGP